MGGFAEAAGAAESGASGPDGGLTARLSSDGTGRVDGIAPADRTAGAALSFPLLLPCVVTRKRAERLGEAVAAPLVAVPLATGGGAIGWRSPLAPGRISPRAS